MGEDLFIQSSEIFSQVIPITSDPQSHCCNFIMHSFIRRLECFHLYHCKTLSPKFNLAFISYYNQFKIHLVQIHVSQTFHHYFQAR